MPGVQIGKGTKVVVTGASRGIGEAIARALADRGATVGLIARTGGDLEQLRADLPGDGHKALTADVVDPKDVAGALEQFGELDVLVANAGVANYGRFVDQDPEAAQRMTQINWYGTLNSVRAALPAMLARGRGHIVITSSGAALRTFPEAAVYGATKAAQRGFANALRQELAGTGVSVTTVFPGEIKSHLHAHERDTMPEWYASERAADPEPLGKRVVQAVERDKRELYHPPIVRALGFAEGLSPRLADFLLRRLRGRAAAPRK
ncbi:MAG: SDR family oxidoreductase [Thermoleophilaceae bacterium]